jgi:transcriptional regulator with XRE-family HTH domain
MLKRITERLNQDLRVEIAPKEDFQEETQLEPKRETLRYVFHEILRGIRKRHGLTIDQLARKSGINRNELIALEQELGYRPKPLTLHRLSKFYHIPSERLLMLAGATKQIPGELQHEASRFAAKSESFARLTEEEKQVVDEFVKFLRQEKRS